MVISIFSNDLFLKFNGRNLIEHDEILGDHWNKSYSNKILSFHKDFNQVIPHKYIRIEANFHFSSDFWKGQGVILKIDNEIVWVDHHNWEG